MKRKLARILFVFFLVVLFVEILIIAPEQLNFETKSSVSKEVQTAAEQVMSQVHLVEAQGGRREWELLSDRAEGFVGKGEWKLKKVKAVFYSPNGATYTVRGDNGKINTSSKDMEIEGRVHTISSLGYEFKSQYIHYRSTEKKLYGGTRVEMLGKKEVVGGRMHLFGTNMVTFLDSNLMELSKDVEAERPMENGKVLKINSQGAQFSGTSQLARFFGAVDLYYQNVHMRGNEAVFAYQKDSELPRALVLTGGVLIEDADKKASGENLRVDFALNQYILTGAPKLIQAGDELIGEEIVFLDGGRRVRVEKAKAKVHEVEGKK